jgi:hypothetical protein
LWDPLVSFPLLRFRAIIERNCCSGASLNFSLVADKIGIVDRAGAGDLAARSHLRPRASLGDLAAERERRLGRLANFAPFEFEFVG